MPLPCPDCSAPVPEPAASCPACGLPLVGPAARRLSELDQALAALCTERAQVLAVLRAARVAAHAGVGGGGGAGAPGGTGWGPAGPALPVQPGPRVGSLRPALGWSAGAAAGPVAVRRPRSSVLSRSPQQVLLGLGALLLLVAATVFLAVARSP